jgi:ribosomal protein S12 methylthiotransferase accessory factor YcaO
MQDLKNRDFKVNLLDYSNQVGIPSVICVIEKDGGWSCGGTTGLNIDSVIQRAVSESMAAYLWYVKNIAEEGNSISHIDIAKVQDGFTDDMYGETNNKIMIYNQKHFIDKNKDSLGFVLSGKSVNYTEQYNKEIDYDIKKHATDIFGDVYFYKVENNYLSDFNYFVKKVIVPNSYSFPMDEKYSRPILNGDYPQVTILNPFV